MAGNVVNVKLKLTADGVAQQQKASKDIADNYERANRAGAGIGKRTGPAPAQRRSAAEESVPLTSTNVTDREYGKVRGAVGTGAAGRDFAKQSQGLGGLVGLYATFAANIFAVGAAFEALNKAAAAERIGKATEMMSVSTGIHLKSVSKNLIEASGNALSFAEAMQFTNVGTSAGLAARQIESLTKIAKGAANALNRDVGDSVRRIIQGTAKQEQEILDELGIFIKASQAYEAFSKANKVKVDDMTGAQRTQAYANEVERLGMKWNEFAEIPDPFSKFTATGKDALNDLLASVNKVFIPLLSFLSDSKEGIQSLIILVSAGLAKRALPELGGMFNNLFNYDKTAATAKAKEATDNLNAISSKMAADYAAANAKLKVLKAEQAALLIPTIDKNTIASSLGASGNIVGKNKEYGLSPIRLNNILKEEGATKSLLATQQSVQKVLEAQLKDKAKDAIEQEKMLKVFKAKSLIEHESTVASITLGKESLRIAETQYLAHESVNKALARKLELTTLVRTQEAKVSGLESSMLSTGTSAPKQAAAPTGAVRVASNAAVTASNASVIASNAAVAASVNGVATAEVRLAAVREQGIIAANLLNQAAGVGVLAALKSAITGVSSILSTAWVSSFGIATAATAKTSVSVNILDLAMLKLRTTVAAVALAAALNFSGALAIAGRAMGVLTNIAILSSGVFKALGVALSFVGKAALALSGPIMIAWTVWSLFGDSIKKWIGIDTKAAERLEEGKKKQEEYAEAVGLSAMSLKEVNKAREEGITSIEQKIHNDNIELNALRSHVDAYTALMEKKKEAKERETLDDLKKNSKPGAVFSEEAFRLTELSKSTLLTKEQKIEVKALAEETQKLANARSVAIGAGIVIAETNLGNIHAKSVAFTKELIPLAQQRAAEDNKVTTASEAITKAIEEQAAATKKLGAPELNLNNERAKSIYDGLTKLIDANTDSKLKAARMEEILNQTTLAGGEAAVVAAKMLNILTGARLAAARIEYIDPEWAARLMSDAFAQIDALKLTLSRTFNDIKAPKAIVPYTPESKNLFAALKNDIDETSLKLKQLSGEQAASAAIEARLTSIKGSTSVDAINTAKKLTDQQAELNHTKDMVAATLDYQKVMKDRSKVGAEGEDARKEATLSLRNKTAEINLTKEQADKLSYINTINSLISKSTADQTTELKKRADLETLSVGYADQRRAANDADLEYAIERGYLTGKEIVDAQYLLEIEKQKVATKSGLDANKSSFQAAIVPQLAVLATPGDTEGDLAGKEAARAKLIEIEESYHRQNALILAGAEGLAFQTTRAHELKSALAGSTDNMDKMKSITESLAVVFGDLGSSVGSVGEAILKMAQDEEKHAKAKKGFEEQRDDPNSDMKDRKHAMGEIARIEKKESKDKLGNIANVAGATKKMFKEHTGAYKVLATVEKATHAFKMAMQIKEMALDAAAFFKKMFFVQAEVPAVAGATAAKTGIELAGQAATMPAKIAGIYASFMSMLGPFGPPAAAIAIAALIGSFAGGGKNAPAPGGFSAEEQQKSQGTGQSWGTINGKSALVENGMGTFGDSSAKSESIVNSLEIMKANSIEGLDYDNKILKAMQRVADAIGTAAASIYQIPGIRVGSAVGTIEGTSGGTTLGWGKTRSTSIEDSGIKLLGTFTQLADAASNAAKVYENIKTETRKKTWISDKTKVSHTTKLLELEKDQAKAIADIFTNATSVFIEIGKTAGVTEATVRNKLSTLDIDLKASTRGLTGEDLEKELNAVIGGALSAGAKSIFSQFDKYKKFGEDYLQTTIRVVDGNNKVDQALRSMGNTFDVTIDRTTKVTRFWGFLNRTIGETKFDISEALIKGAGSLESFMEQASFFTDSFLTDEERLAPVQEAVSERLKDLGLSSTLSRDSFKKLVLAQDLSSEAGRTMYQNLMELAPGFDQVTKGIDDTTKKLASFEEAIYKLRGDTGKALALARARELEDLDVSLRASQSYVWALEDEISVKDRLTASINNNISSLKANIKTVQDYSEKIKLGTSSVMTPAQKYAEAKGQLGDIYALASSSPTTDAEKAARNEAVGKLSSASETFLTMSKTMFASSEQYVQDYQSILQMLDSTEVDLKGQLTDAEKQLEEVKTSNSYLKSMDESTYSTAQLMQQFLTAASASETARVAAGESGSLAALAIPARANGGYASGLTLVGENGPELANFTKPAMVYSNEASNDILNTKELVAEIKSLHKELAQLRKDQQEQTGHLIATNYDANQKAAAQVTKSSESVAATNLWVQRSQAKIA